MKLLFGLFTFLTLTTPGAWPRELETATIAAGCFWGTEEFFRKIPGVVETQVGFAGGKTQSPSYEQVSTGQTGYAESLELKFDPKIVSYEKLLDLFFKMHDPTTLNQQGNDRGSQYRSAIFYHGPKQKEVAEKFKEKVQKSGAWNGPITTEIAPAGPFYRAEEHHQKYLVKNPGGYDNHYSRNISFDSPAKKPDLATLRKTLTHEQFHVTQESGTEPPFQNAYWNNHRAGIYVDVVTGEPLFSSEEKYDSGTGWPSFWSPLVPQNIKTVSDDSLMGESRTEVRSKNGDSHLGHVFNDGPQPTHLRYCMNSASLRFIPVEELEKSGYGEFVSHFKKKAGK